MDNTIGYPGWMLGYWHGIVVAGGVDNLCGTPFCKPEQARRSKKKLAIITYALVSPDAWADKQINYGWGSMNMPVGRWGGRVVMASALSDHPLAKDWLKDAGRYFSMLLETEYAPDGSHISCPHYIGASSTSFYAWIALANSGLAEDVSTSPALQKFARFYMQLMKPIDPRWGIRVLLNEGDTRPGSSPLPAILARLFKQTDPQLAGELMQVWIEGGRDLSSGMGIPDALIIDPQHRAASAEAGTAGEPRVRRVSAVPATRHARGGVSGLRRRQLHDRPRQHRPVRLRVEREGRPAHGLRRIAVPADGLHRREPHDHRLGRAARRRARSRAKTNRATGTTTTTSRSSIWAARRRDCTGRSASTKARRAFWRRGAWSRWPPMRRGRRCSKAR